MAQARKDSKGRTFRKGEGYRENKKLYYYCYKNPFGKRSYIYARTLLDLRKKEEELKKDQLDGIDVYVKGKATVNFVFDRYLGTKVELRNTTRANYEYMYDKFVRKTFGKNMIADVRYSDVVTYYQDLLKKVGISTVSNIQTLLHPTFQMAVRDDIIRANPTDGVLGDIKKKSGLQSGVRHALTVDEQMAFEEALELPEHRRWRPIFIVLLGTGMRVGELVGLRWEDIDLENETISVNHQIVYYADASADHRASHFQVSRPKTDKGVRVIPMLREVKEAFQEEEKFQKMFDLFNTQTVDGMSGFIFCNRYGNLFNESSLNRAIKRIVSNYNSREVVRARKTGYKPVLIPEFSCHVLRHTFCTRLCEQATNIKVVQTIMGHADITTTMNIYADCTLDAEKESFEKLDMNYGVFNRRRPEASYNNSDGSDEDGTANPE